MHLMANIYDYNATMCCTSFHSAEPYNRSASLPLPVGAAQSSLRPFPSSSPPNPPPLVLPSRSSASLSRSLLDSKPPARRGLTRVGLLAPPVVSLSLICRGDALLKYWLLWVHFYDLGHVSELILHSTDVHAVLKNHSTPCHSSIWQDLKPCFHFSITMAADDHVYLATFSIFVNLLWIFIDLLKIFFF